MTILEEIFISYIMKTKKIEFHIQQTIFQIFLKKLTAFARFTKKLVFEMRRSYVTQERRLGTTI